MLSGFFQPKTIALIGASATKGKLGNDILLNLIATFKGTIYPVHPKNKTVEGIPVFPSILNTPTTPDLAIIAIPAQFVLATLDDIGKCGCKSVIIITAGFKEVGAEGAALEKKMRAIAEQYDIRILGPNCLGLISTRVPLNASFAATMPKPGNIAFFSQSGAMGTAVLDIAKAQRLGIAHFVSMGNKSDIDEIDLLHEFSTDDTVSVIIGYIEDIVDGPIFVEQATKTTAKKPIILLKAGKSQEGQKAVASHTGALAGKAEIYSAAFAQAGVIEVEGTQDLFDFAEGFSYQPLPKGKRIAIVTNAGGPGIIATDFLKQYGLELAELSPKTKKKLRQKLPAHIGIHNPIDIVGDAKADRYEAAVKAVAEDEGIDGVIVLLTPQKMTEIEKTTRIIGAVAKHSDKPFLLGFMGEAEITPFYELFHELQLPQFPFPEQTVKVMASMYSYAKWREEQNNSNKIKLKEIQKKEVVEYIHRKKILTEADCREILQICNFPVNTTAFITSETDIPSCTESLCHPYALKVVSPDILHKSDVGGVVLNLNSKDEVKTALMTMKQSIEQHLPKAKIDGFLLSEMADGITVIVGVKNDAQFGPVVMFGMGGIYAEVFKDVAFRVAPFTKQEALAMIEETKVAKLLHGVRGDKPADVDVLADLLVKTGEFAVNYPDIKELDFNPVIVQEKGKGVSIVDVRMIKEN